MLWPWKNPAGVDNDVSLDLYTVHQPLFMSSYAVVHAHGVLLRTTVNVTPMQLLGGQVNREGL